MISGANVAKVSNPLVATNANAKTAPFGTHRTILAETGVALCYAFLESAGAMAQLIATPKAASSLIIRSSLGFFGQKQ